MALETNAENHIAHGFEPIGGDHPAVQVHHGVLHVINADRHFSVGFGQIGSDYPAVQVHHGVLQEHADVLET